MTNKSSNSNVSNEDVNVLLQLRAEIKEQINKLEAEYRAIEHLLIKLHQYEKPSGIAIDVEIDRLNKLKEQENRISEEVR